MGDAASTSIPHSADLTKTMRAEIPRNIGRYEVIGELGSGGMADVYLGRSVGMGGFERLVAIKTIHAHLAKQPNFMRMFLDEARIAARIRHPNVVQVFEVGEHAGRLFIAMDYVSGESLSATMRRLGQNKQSLDIGVAGFLAFSACEALHAAHESRDAEGNLLGVIHRDVSPKNMIIGYDGTLRLLDFGVAKARDQLDTTATGTRKGTAAYMAPEQLLDSPIDRRADVFALGVVLWEITTGKRLFRASNDFATVENVRRCRVPRPSSVRADYPGKLERVVMKALRRLPEDRYASAREFGEDLREVLGSRAKLMSSIDVERFMQTMFADRFAEKQAMERNALSTTPMQFHVQRSESASFDTVGSPPAAQSPAPVLTLRPSSADDDDDSDPIVDAKTAVRPEASDSAARARPLQSGVHAGPQASTKALLAAAVAGVLVAGIGWFFALRSNAVEKEPVVHAQLPPAVPAVTHTSSVANTVKKAELVAPPVVAPPVVAPPVIAAPAVEPAVKARKTRSVRKSNATKNENDPTLVGGDDL